MKTINPYLIFNGTAEEVFTFYQKVFGGDLIKVRYGDMPASEKIPEEEHHKMAHIALPLAKDGQILMASDSTNCSEVEAVKNGAFHICIEAESREETERVFRELSEGGSVQMPLAKADWAELAAMFTDRFGTQWILNYGEGEV